MSRIDIPHKRTGQGVSSILKITTRRKAKKNEGSVNGKKNNEELLRKRGKTEILMKTERNRGGY